LHLPSLPGFDIFHPKFDKNVLDGSKQEYTKTVAADFSSDITMTTLGINYHWHFNADGSGNGTITGQGQGLPATMTWDTAGVGVITWSDGTTSPFDGVKTL